MRYRIALRFTATITEDVEVQSEAELWQYKEDVYEETGAKKSWGTFDTKDIIGINWRTDWRDIGGLNVW
jgi:hypothetical protein